MSSWHIMFHLLIMKEEEKGKKKIKSDSNARAQIPCAPVADREDAAMAMGVQRENKTKKLKTVFNHQ